MSFSGRGPSVFSAFSFSVSTIHEYLFPSLESIFFIYSSYVVAFATSCAARSVVFAFPH